MIDINVATEKATDYCQQNGLSVDKLRTQLISIINDSLYFWQENEAVPNGLKNDLDTMPYHTLIVKNDYSVHSTPYSTTYLR